MNSQKLKFGLISCLYLAKKRLTVISFGTIFLEIVIDETAELAFRFAIGFYIKSEFEFDLKVSLFYLFFSRSLLEFAVVLKMQAL